LFVCCLFPKHFQVCCGHHNKKTARSVFFFFGQCHGQYSISHRIRGLPKTVVRAKARSENKGKIKNKSKNKSQNKSKSQSKTKNERKRQSEERESGSEQKVRLLCIATGWQDDRVRREPAQEIEQRHAHILKRARETHFQIEITATRNCVCVCACVLKTQIENQKWRNERERGRQHVCMYMYTCGSGSVAQAVSHGGDVPKLDSCFLYFGAFSG